jgi:hypothetical protein
MARTSSALPVARRDVSIGWRFPIAAIAIAGLTLGCQSLQSVEPHELEGDWVASQARFVEIAAPKRNNVDLIDLGYEIDMTLDASGNFLLGVLPPESSPNVIPGSLVISGTKLEVTTDGGTGDGEVFLQGEQVAFRLVAGFTHDFGDGRGEIPARLLLVLDRTGS